MLVAILSCGQNQHKQDVVRSTWLPKIRRQGFSAVFVTGGSDNGVVHRDDVVCVPTADTYEALPQKILSFYRYAASHLNFDYIFKCDDDTYVYSDQLSQLPLDADFIGGNLLYYDEETYRLWMDRKHLRWDDSFRTPLNIVQKYPCGGEGYFLSSRAVSILAHANPHIHIPASEDLVVTSLLASHQIYPRQETRFAYSTSDLSISILRKTADVATLHPVSTAQMLSLRDRPLRRFIALHAIRNTLRTIKRQISRSRNASQRTPPNIH